MSDFDAENHETALDSVISNILVRLNGMDSSTEEYSDTADQLIKLAKLKKEINPSWMPSPDAIVGAAASILGIILVLNYEKLGIVTSKAWSFIGRSFK